MLDIKDAFVDVAAGRIFTRTWTPAAPTTHAPILLLHDSLGCVDLWRDFPALLARRLARPVIAYDRLGYGRSTACRELPSLHFIRQEAELRFPLLREALGFDRCVLMGHSTGGAMALLMAASSPDLCQTVVTEAAQAFVETRTRNGVREARERFKTPGQFEKLAKWHGDKARWVLAAWVETWLSDAFADWSLASDLPRVRCPVLAIHGDRDEYGSVAFPQTICRLVAGPSEMAILEGCGHVPHRERQDDVLDRVSRFLA